MPKNNQNLSESGDSAEWFDAWRGVLFAHAHVIREVESYLQSEHDLALSWFDVLSRLSGAPENRLRMSELSEAALFTRSGLTRLVDRIEEAGMVRRERITGDRRGVSVVLTPAGKKKFEDAFEGHKAIIEQAFASKMSPSQRRAVGAALGVFLP
jgi:DNA-binding MarR family transcriptional regulator